MARKVTDELLLPQSSIIAVLGLLYTLTVITIFCLCLQMVGFLIG